LYILQLIEGRKIELEFCMNYAAQTFVTMPNKLTLATVSCHAQAVYVWMCSMQDETGVCWPSIAKLAELTHTSRSTVKRACSELEATGLMARQFTDNRKRKTVNRYQVLIKDTEAAPVDSSDRTIEQIRRFTLNQQTVHTEPSTVHTEPLTIPNRTKPKELKKSLVDSAKPKSTGKTYRVMFSELVQALGFSDRVLPTDGRLRKLRVRLKSFSYPDVLAAAQAIGADGYLQGDNPGGKRYGDIDYLLRSDEIVDKYRQLAETTSHQPFDLSKEVLL
jgi:DNA-binding transcriptional regulator YhcF (GntR family)